MAWRYARALQSLPLEVTRPSSWRAWLRLVNTLVFCGLSVHAISIAPTWLLPLCWVFAALALVQLFDIGHDCSHNAFFPSEAVNFIVGVISLLPLIQPLAFWRGRKQNASKKSDGAAEGLISVSTSDGVANVVPSNISNWSAAAWRWSSVLEGLHISHVLVWLFVLWFFPFMLSRVGVWGLVKLWLVPFILFHLCMFCVFYIAHRLKPGNRESWSIADDFSLSSYLRFELAVPSYRIGDAMDRVKRMWNRAKLDGSDGPVAPLKPPEKSYHETLSVAAFWRGLSSLRVFESLLSVVSWSMASLWVYLLWTSLPAGRRLELTETVFADAVAFVRGLFVDQPQLAALGGVIVFLFVVLHYNRLPDVYVVDFVTYTAPKELSVNHESFRALQRKMNFSEESLQFMDRLIDRTGLGETTYLAPGHLAPKPDMSMPMARLEAEMVLFGVCDQLFATTQTKPTDIDILVVNCSLFCPTPSLCAMVINRYKMREDIQSYNLGGMGCSAGVIAVHLAKDLLRVYRKSLALVISTENITQNWYKGSEKGMLMSNCLFRMGGAAVLLSNRRRDRARSKYRVLHTIRTHRGRDDHSYKAVWQDMDAEGCQVGVRLSKELMAVAGEALKRNITTLGPLILPWSEQARYFFNLLRRKYLGHKIDPYLPNFKKAVNHFCIHAGGRAVIEKIEEALKLSPSDVEASKQTLFRYGNTSSSSIWYELAYLEKKGAVMRGHRVWQIAFGSGFKCNSAILEAL